jgi:hypothetical protein
MHEELQVVGSSPHLSRIVASEVSAALTLLARKAEYMAATGPDLRAVADRAGQPANPSQLRNIALCSQLQEVYRQVHRRAQASADVGNVMQQVMYMSGQPVLMWAM